MKQKTICACLAVLNIEESKVLHRTSSLQANAIITKVQSNLAASEKFFVEEQTRQSMVSFAELFRADSYKL